MNCNIYKFGESNRSQPSCPFLHLRGIFSLLKLQIHYIKERWKILHSSPLPKHTHYITCNLFSFSPFLCIYWYTLHMVHSSFKYIEKFLLNKKYNWIYENRYFSWSRFTNIESESLFMHQNLFILRLVNVDILHWK